MNTRFLSSVLQVEDFLFLLSRVENDIFLEYTSRLLNPTEYVFDILNEYTRSNINNYHLILKRTVWFDLPLQRSADAQSDMFVDFMYHQLIPEFLEGTSIVLTKNQLPDESMVNDF